jgi:hypothetical protein
VNTLSTRGPSCVIFLESSNGRLYTHVLQLYSRMSPLSKMCCGYPWHLPSSLSLLLQKNNKVAHYVENDVLQVALKPRERMNRAVSSFSEAFARIRIALSPFNRWHPESRFTLVTVLKDSPPELRIDAVPSSIQYQPSSYRVEPSNSFNTITPIMY